MAGAGRTATEPVAAAEIARACGGLPLAMRIAGARLAAHPAWSVQVLADRLADEQRRLAELRHGDLDVRTRFEVGYRRLPPAAARVFRLLGLPEGADLGPPAVAALAGLPPERTGEILDTLADAHLVRAGERHGLHVLLRLLARERLHAVDPEGERVAALERLLDFHISTILNARRLIRSNDARPPAGAGLTFADATSAVAWLEAERPGLLVFIRQAARTEHVPAELPGRLFSTMFEHISTACYGGLGTAVEECAHAAVRQRDQRTEAAMRSILGVLLGSRSGGYEEGASQLRRSLALHRQAGDRLGEAGALRRLGVVARANHRFGESVADLGRSLWLLRRHGTLADRPLTLIHLGLAHQARGAFEPSVVLFDQAVRLTRPSGDHLAEAYALAGAGDGRCGLGRYEEAENWHRRCLGLSRDLGYRHT